MIARLLRSSIQIVPWKYRTKVKNWPVIGPLQRWVIQRFLAQGQFLHTVNAGPAKGLRYWIQLPDDKAVWTGTYELNFSTALSEAVQKNDVCLDIGGYRGFFSGVFALAGAREVHSFEPLPANNKKIRALIEANPELPLRLHEVAVGAEVGEAEFSIMPEDSMGKLSTSSFQEKQHGKDILTVQIETLDHLRATNVIPGAQVVKIDVEGAEAMVLKGGMKFFRSEQPRVFIEIHSRGLAKECYELLTQLGYTVRVLETNRAPDFHSEPEVCHFVAMAPKFIA
ncbi:MAG: FkbM family methyltransferase [Verrucomicrobiota bacterium]